MQGLDEKSEMFDVEFKFSSLASILHVLSFIEFEAHTEHQSIHKLFLSILRSHFPPTQALYLDTTLYTVHQLKLYLDTTLYTVLQLKTMLGYCIVRCTSILVVCTCTTLCCIKCTLFTNSNLYLDTIVHVHCTPTQTCTWILHCTLYKNSNLYLGNTLYTNLNLYLDYTVL